MHSSALILQHCEIMHWDTTQRSVLEQVQAEFIVLILWVVTNSAELLTSHPTIQNKFSEFVIAVIISDEQKGGIFVQLCLGCKV